MLYPRLTHSGELVNEDQTVSIREHLSMKHRILHVSGIISGDTDFGAVLFALDSLSHDPIKVIIDSLGGHLDAVFMYCDILNLIKSPIYTLGKVCCSAAVFLLASGQERYLLPHSKVMMHLPSSGFEGDSKDWPIRARQVELYQTKMTDLLKACGVSRSSESILEDIDREYWLEPQEAIDYGLADRIIDKETLGQWLEPKALGGQHYNPWRESW